MDAQLIQARWPLMREQVKERWTKLTDKDLEIGNGNVDHLIGWISKQTGENRQAVEGYLTDLASQASSFAGRARGIVRERPVESIAACFAAGTLVGLLIGAALRR